MNVIAERAGTYLVGDIEGHAVIVDVGKGTVSAPILAESVLSRGYWRPFTGDPAPIVALAVTTAP